MLWLLLIGCILLYSGMFSLSGFFSDKNNWDSLKVTFALLAVGGALLMLSMASFMSILELAGFLTFFLSCLFLVPAVSYYKKYRVLMNRIWLSDEEQMEKERAWNASCAFFCLFIIGIIAGFLLLFQALAI